MSYLYETHLHSMESSLCAKTSAADYPAYYKAAGFDGIFLTDHFYRGNHRFDLDLPWEDFVRNFCHSYEVAKAAGDAIGMPVFFGFEERFDLDEYLIYGIDRDFLLAHPELATLPRAEYLALVRAAGGMVIQAHPMREYKYSTEIHLPVDSVDGYEGWNGGTKLPQNLRANALAWHLDKPMTAGGDRHCLGDKYPFYGIETETPITCVADYIEIVKSRAFTIHGTTPTTEGVDAPTLPVRVYDLFGKAYSPTRAMQRLPAVFFKK